jgi:hypothetical protein
MRARQPVTVFVSIDPGGTMGTHEAAQQLLLILIPLAILALIHGRRTRERG